jgi:Protein of unknown function (DUF3618)
VAERTDPDEIQREIERTRAELAETIDAIADRVSPKRVAARTADRVRAAVKGDGARPQVVVGSADGASPAAAPTGATAADRHEANARATGLPGAVGGARYTIQRRLRTDRVLIVAGAVAAVIALVVIARRRTKDDLDLDYQF